jgi:hypothetical protein
MGYKTHLWFFSCDILRYNFGSATLSEYALGSHVTIHLKFLLFSRFKLKFEGDDKL